MPVIMGGDEGIKERFGGDEYEEKIETMFRNKMLDNLEVIEGFFHARMNPSITSRLSSILFLNMVSIFSSYSSPPIMTGITIGMIFGKRVTTTPMNMVHVSPVSLMAADVSMVRSTISLVKWENGSGDILTKISHSLIYSR